MKPLKILLISMACLLPNSIYAQIDVKEKVKNQTNNRANNRVDQGIDKSLDAVENGIKGLFKKKKKNGGEDTLAVANEQQNTKASPANSTQNPSLTAYSKFDFIPGEKVIFYEDFTQDAVGDFPALWYSNGSGEVVTLNNYPDKWLDIKAQGWYYPEVDMATTENFTIEFDLIPVIDPKDDAFNFYFMILSDNIKNRDRDPEWPGKAGIKIGFNGSGIRYEAFAGNEGNGSGTKEMEINPHAKIHLSYWVQKTRIRIYVNENKAIDSPRAMPGNFKFNVLLFYMTNAYDASCAIANFRVAVGLPDTRSKLLTEGKLVTYGIYFDVNKDIVKAESYGTLSDIAKVLKENPTVRIKIVGHTDADGADAANLDLSKRRGASVKNELVKTFGIDASRIESDGLGETKPIAPNDTPANRALNRRVEFIKIN